MIKIIINDKPIDEVSIGKVIDINELDKVTFQIDLDLVAPKLFIEDYEVLLKKNKYFFSSESYQFFRESFGLSYIRIYTDKEVYEYVFNVLAQKITCDQAHSIIQYVYLKNPNLLKINFSRTTLEQSLVRDEDTQFESFLDFSQSLITYLDNRKENLKKFIKKQLLSKKKSSENHINQDIHPEDVLFNLDKLFQDNNSSEILINGKFYSSNNLPATVLIDTFDFKENQIILAALFYIHSNLNNFLKTLESINLIESNHSDKEYSNFIKKDYYRNDLSKIILQVTSIGLLKRINLIIKEVEHYIRFFKNSLQVSYSGPIYPKLTQIANTNIFYKEVFKKISAVYECGSFGLNGISAKIKIRSMSKIYEFFCLYKIIDCLQSLGFIIVNEVEKNNLPNLFVLQKEEKVISIFYEKVISYISQYDKKESDLVSTNYSHENSIYGYYNPDYIILIHDKIKKTKNYYILDAKFRSFESLQRNQVLKNTKQKYFDNIKYLNFEKNTLSNKNILGNIILYQGKKNFSLFENIHLQGFTTLPIFEAVSLYDEFEPKLMEKLISYCDC